MQGVECLIVCASVGKAGSRVVDCGCQWGRRGVECLTVNCASVGKAGSGMVDCVCDNGEG